MNKVLGRISAFTQAQLSRFASRDEGATAVEYGLIIALVAGAIIVAVGLLGGAVSGAFTHVATAVTNAAGAH
jgi:pilus assembly protein Flp/PilA